MLFSVKLDEPDVLATDRSEPQSDIVAGPELMHEPSNTMSFIARRVFMTRHGAAGVSERTWLSYGASKVLM